MKIVGRGGSWTPLWAGRDGGDAAGRAAQPEEGSVEGGQPA